MFCLDTNIVISTINRRPTHIRARLESELASGVVVGVPAVVLFEMHYGAAKSDRRERSEAALDAFLSLAVTPWPFEPDDAAHAGDIRATLEAAGTPIGAYDCLIAAQARRRGATLVTANSREFARVTGLLLTDWAA
ncbi:MAG TPA: type II toxin-antitoxin system VapC family toxin [Bradyrhizobium sp.]|nr:type II toxin-antitoxin system VapC family toxin [Bradyrhizobium sp.]